MHAHLSAIAHELLRTARKCEKTRGSAKASIGNDRRNFGEADSCRERSPFIKRPARGIQSNSRDHPTRRVRRLNETFKPIRVAWGKFTIKRNDVFALVGSSDGKSGRHRLAGANERNCQAVRDNEFHHLPPD